MSIYIKSMEMPKGCGVCPFADDECWGAWKCWRVKDWGDDDNRAKGCPLVHVPSHGRLIDADALIKELGIGDLPIRLTHEIINASTVIPAEEGE